MLLFFFDIQRVFLHNHIFIRYSGTKYSRYTLFHIRDYSLFCKPGIRRLRIFCSRRRILLTRCNYACLVGNSATGKLGHKLDRLLHLHEANGVFTPHMPVTVVLDQGRHARLVQPQRTVEPAEQHHDQGYYSRGC